MLFEHAASLVDTATTTKLRNELDSIKKNLFESDEFSELTDKLGASVEKTEKSDISTNATDQTADNTQETPPVSDNNLANKAATTIRINRPQQQLSQSGNNTNIPISQAPVALPTVIPAKPNSVTPPSPGNDTVVINLDPNLIGKKLAVTSNGMGAPVQSLNDDLMTDPTDVTSEMHLGQMSSSMDEAVITIEKNPSVHEIGHDDNIMDVDVPDGAGDLAKEFADAVLNAAPELNKGTLSVKSQPQTLREKPISSVRVQAIHVLDPEQDITGSSVAGLDNDIALKLL